MARRRSWTALWRDWRRPLLLPVFLLLVALCAAVLPPVDLADITLDDLALFTEEPQIRALLVRCERGGHVDVGGPVRMKDRSRTTVLDDGGSLRWDGRTVRVGDKRFTPPIDVAPPRGAAVGLLGRRYAGTLRLVADGDELLVVNRVPIETYLAGVIAVEMGVHWPDEALKAQAVACRSYAVRRVLARRNRAYDVGATQATQVYRGIPAGNERARRLVHAVRAEVLTFDDQVLDAVYSSTCGGTTRPADEAFGNAAPPPLMGGPCGYCEDAPLYSWSAVLTTTDVLRDLGIRRGDVRLGRLRYHASGRLRDLTLETSSGPRIVSAKRLVRMLGPRARSPYLARVDLERGRLHVHGRGFGHGVGLCQYGARGLARRRKGVDQILGWYYRGAKRARAW